MIIRTIILIIITFFYTTATHAQSAVRKNSLNAQQPSSDRTHVAKKYKVNSSTISIMTGPYTGTYLRIGADLSAVMDGAKGLRVLPILTAGSIKNMKDILYLRGIDLGIIQADVLGYLERSEDLKNIKKRVAYITKLYNEEAHLLTKKSIKSISDLSGRRVNCGRVGSGTSVTCSTVFSKLNIDIRALNTDDNTAFKALQDNKIDAMFFVAGKPAGFTKQLVNDGSLHLLKIPYNEALQSTYLPSTITSGDYPNLIAPGEDVQTIATSAVMAVYNWPRDAVRYRKVKVFVDEFFSRFKEFTKQPRHPKWKEVNLGAKLPGWTRFSAAQDWLAGQNNSSSDVDADFQNFIAKLSNGGKPSYSKKELKILYGIYKKQRLN